MNLNIFINTLYLYGRTIFTAGLGLVTLSISLKALGHEGFGVYNVLLGVVSFASFLQLALNNVTQRFIAHRLGGNKKNEISKIFSLNILLYFIICVLVFIGFKLTEQFYVKSDLKIPSAYDEVFIEVYNYVAISFIFTFISSPFISLLLASEDMKLYAAISILDAVLKMLASSVLFLIEDGRLLIFAKLMCAETLLIFAIYFFLTRAKYKNIRFSISLINIPDVIEILRYISWTLYGSFTSVVKVHGITLMINQLSSPAIVAARIIALNVANSVKLLSYNFNLSINPPIIKSFAINDHAHAYNLVLSGSRLTFALMWIVCAPVLLNMNYLLALWNGNLPDYTASISKLMIFEVLISSTSAPLASAARALGNIKWYEIILGTMQLCIIPLAYVLYVEYETVESIFYVAVLVNIMMFFVRLKIVSVLTGLAVVEYVKLTLIPIVKVIFVIAVLLLLFQMYFREGLWSFICFSIINFLITVVILISRDERKMLYRKITGR